MKIALTVSAASKYLISVDWVERELSPKMLDVIKDCVRSKSREQASQSLHCYVVLMFHEKSRRDRRLTQAEKKPRIWVENAIKVSNNKQNRLPTHDSRLNILFTAVYLTFGSYAESSSQAKRKKFSWILRLFEDEAEKVTKTLLHINADQNTQKVFLFVGVAQWRLCLLSKYTLKCLIWHSPHQRAPWSFFRRFSFLLFHIFFIIKNLK